jgi:hypothetical protein
MAPQETAQARQQLNQWIKRESQRIRDEEGKGNHRRQAQMLAFWEQFRPRMWADLNRISPDAPANLALILNFKMLEAEKQYRLAGMSPTDAMEQACQEWLLMEEEADEPEPNLESDPTALPRWYSLPSATTSSPTPKRS